MIVQTAAKLFNMDELEAEIELGKRLRLLKIPKDAVVIYVNWASHNALTYRKIGELIGVRLETIHNLMKLLKRRFPHLFYFGAQPFNRGFGGVGHKFLNMDWIDAETKRLITDRNESIRKEQRQNYGD
jgi:hypothetical protein